MVFSKMLIPSNVSSSNVPKFSIMRKYFAYMNKKYACKWCEQKFHIDRFQCFQIEINAFIKKNALGCNCNHHFFAQVQP